MSHRALGKQFSVMRGVPVQLEGQALEEFNRKTRLPQTEEEIDQDLTLGSVLARAAHRGEAGFGQHWTGSSHGIAEIGAGARRGGTHTPVILRGTYETDQRINEGFHDEDEYTLSSGTPVTVQAVETRLPMREGWTVLPVDPPLKGHA